MTTLSFHGGAKTVTGANYLIDTGSEKIIVDCGLFQGSKYSEELNYNAFSYNPAEIDFVLITHSHADHVGRLPFLYHNGFRGRIFATDPARAISNEALPDTLKRIAEEARRDGHKPLFLAEDLEGTMKLFTGVPYGKPIMLGNSEAIFHNASHILGSAIIELTIPDGNGKKKIVFSGDLGNANTVLLEPIEYVSGADYVVVESAYGGRLHENVAERRNLLLKAIKDTVRKNGTLMIPSFAIERTQEILVEIDTLFERGKLPSSASIFMDSPLASRITKVYGRYSHYFNPRAKEILRDNRGLFQFPWLNITKSVQDSKNINNVNPPKVILAGSGMSQGGRIIHHEQRYLSDPNSMLLIIGYQVRGSLGRRILDGAPEVSIFGKKIPVRCQVRAIGAYSAHADQDGLADFVEKASEGGMLKKVFIVQGEEDSANALAKRLSEKNIETLVPDLAQTVSL